VRVELNVGDMIKDIRTENGLTGVILNWVQSVVFDRKPLVYWQDGSTSAILPDMIEVVSESR